VACRSTVHLCSRLAGIQRAPLISSGLVLVVSACRITPRMVASRAPTTTPAAAADGGIEENAMAILDSSGIKDSRDLHDDRAAFLEAVRSACLAADNPSAPSWYGTYPTRSRLVTSCLLRHSVRNCPLL